MYMIWSTKNKPFRDCSLWYRGCYAIGWAIEGCPGKGILDNPHIYIYIILSYSIVLPHHRQLPTAIANCRAGRERKVRDQVLRSYRAQNRDNAPGRSVERSSVDFAMALGLVYVGVHCWSFWRLWMHQSHQGRAFLSRRWRKPQRAEPKRLTLRISSDWGLRWSPGEFAKIHPFESIPFNIFQVFIGKNYQKLLCWYQTSQCTSASQCTWSFTVVRPGLRYGSKKIGRCRRLGYGIPMLKSFGHLTYPVVCRPRF